MAFSLKACRVNAKLTQLEASEKLGISVDTLGKWERKETYPSVKYLKRIEEVYGVDCGEIDFLS